MAGSLSRTMVQVSTGGKTMMASAISVFLLLWIILFVGPLFFHLPRVRILTDIFFKILNAISTLIISVKL
jgi:MFS superfamily sulfate permease-like transporter